MRDNVQEFERNVLQGFVLDRKGRWRPVDEVVDEETDFLRHLENGEVLENGRWVKLDDIIKKEAPLPVAEKPVSEQHEEIVKEESHPVVSEQRLPVEAVAPVSSPEEEPMTTPSAPAKEAETETQKTAKDPAVFMDTVVMETAAAPEETLNTAVRAPETIQRAESDDSETKKYELDTAQIELAQTKIMGRESLSVSESEPAYTKDELLSTDEFESVIAGMEQGGIEDTYKEQVAEPEEKPFKAQDAEMSSPALPEESPIPIKQSPSEPITPFTSEAQDEWDRARSKNLKIIIGSIAGGIILILLVVLKFLL
jgi:hypothetical protein